MAGRAAVRAGQAGEAAVHGGAPVIRLAGVGKSYPLYEHALQEARGFLGLRARPASYKQALQGVDLVILRGERVGVVGHNGSGKTTLLRVICGYTRATAGDVRIDGTVQALMQTGYGFSDELTGLQNIRAALVYSGLPGHALADAEADIVGFVELGEFLHHPIKTYSLGMRARLEFATATAIRPSVLAIDEVLSAGDGYFVHKCAERMRKLVSGTTLLLVSHALDQIREYCDRVVWMDAGRVREDGAAATVLEHYRDHMLALSARLDPAPSGAGGPVAAPGTAVATGALLQRLQTQLALPAATPGSATLSYGNAGGTLRVMETGGTLELALALALPRTLRPVVLGLTPEASLLFELQCGPALPAGRHGLRLRAAQLGVGVGNYFLVAGLREPGPEGPLAVLGGEVLELQMAATNWSEPPLVHMDGRWTSGPEHRPLAAKMNAWV